MSDLVPSNLFCHGSVDRPAENVNSLEQRLVFYAKLVSPFCKRLYSAVVFLHERVSAVSNLLCISGPAAIFGRVRTIVVDAVDAVFRSRSLSHICEEVGKVIPSLANSDSSPAVLWVGAVIDIPAPTVNSEPDFMRRGQGCAVRAVGFLNALKTQAPAGHCFAMHETMRGDGLFCPAVAPTKPVDVAAVPADRSYCCEPAYFSAGMIVGKVSKFDWGIMKISHCLVSFKALVRGLPVGAGSSRHYTKPLYIHTPLSGAAA